MRPRGIFWCADIKDCAKMQKFWPRLMFSGECSFDRRGQWRINRKFLEQITWHLRGMYRTNSSENKSRLFCHWFYSLSNQNWNFYKCIFSNYLKWTLSVLLLDSVAWFVPEICHFEIDWSEFHVSKHGKNGHPPSSRWRCKLS